MKTVTPGNEGLQLCVWPHFRSAILRSFIFIAPFKLNANMSGESQRPPQH